MLAARMMPFSSNVERVGILAGGEFVPFLCRDDELTDQRCEPALERGDSFLDRPGARAHLEEGTSEEAATWKRAPPEVVEEGVAECDQLRHSWRGGERRCDDLGIEDLLRFVHGGELEVLLRAEVGVDPALAHVERSGEVADRQAFETVNGCQ